jgi:hypothetical protein
MFDPTTTDGPGEEDSEVASSALVRPKKRRKLSWTQDAVPGTESVVTSGTECAPSIATAGSSAGPFDMEQRYPGVDNSLERTCTYLFDLFGSLTRFSTDYRAEYQPYYDEDFGGSGYYGLLGFGQHDGVAADQYAGVSSPVERLPYHFTNSIPLDAGSGDNVSDVLLFYVNCHY